MGVDGQDGSYLADLLLSKNYDVIGWIPNSISVPLENIQHIYDRINIVKGDLLDQEGLFDLIQEHQPDQLYNLASPSLPSSSWENVIYNSDVTALGVGRLLEAVRQKSPTTKYYQASTSEIFGDPVEVPQNENTPFCPRNPYGVAKLFAHWLTVNYRNKYDLFTISGILFNHESPRRGYDYVTRKISRGVAEIKIGKRDELLLGNLDARRDWGYAEDYVKAMWLMLQQDEPIDYVVGTGETHSVREFCEVAFNTLGLDYKQYVRVNDEFLRPEENKQLVADPNKIMNVLKWEPSISFSGLVEKMVKHDYAVMSGSE
jgi:GDPmannose 4,6-dehydratase